MGDNNQKEMKIHYLWDNWKIQYRLNLRNKIKEATKNEKINLAKHMGLEYLCNQMWVCFQVQGIQDYNNLYRINVRLWSRYRN